MVKDEIQEIHITDITAHGMGVGRGADGAAVFVRGALPGDTVLARCYRAKKRYAEAETVKIVSPSPDRVESFCDLGAHQDPEDHSSGASKPLSGSGASKLSSCGGCQYCELAYRKQTEIKRSQIIQDLTRIGGLEDPEVDETIAMDEPYCYRNKVTFQVGWNGSTPVVGFYRAGSHDIVDCPVCRIQAPPAEAVASSLRTFMLQEKITCFDSKTRKGLLKDVIVRSCFATGEVMVVLEINGASIPEAGRLIDMMDSQINRMSFEICWSLESVYIVNDKNVPVLIAGKKTVSEELGGVKFEISPMSFYQVNPVQTVKLYDKVFEYAALSPGDSLLDLYCGVGSIGLYLEDRMDDTVSVLGVESNSSAVLDANRNAVINGVINARYICGAAEDVLPDILGRMSEHASSAAGGTGEGRGAVDNDESKQSCDEPEEGSTEWFARNVLASVNVAVLDPPRAGCDEKLLQAVCDVSPERIVYVSCDPATLARDVKYLTGSGYRFIKATPVDMFPHTGHIETVCLLSNTQRPKKESYITLDVEMEDYYRMAKMVGYACSIRLSWLNEAVRMLKEELPEAEYKEKMNEYLSYEIDSPTRLRKTREILMNVWYYPSEELDPVRKDALEVLAEYPDCSEPIQYLMLCLTYPVFKDVCKIMGKLFEFQDEITNPALKQKLYDAWGERGTLETTTRRITLTLKEMDILRNETKTRYVLHKIPITNDKVLDFVIAQGMKLDGSSYYSYTELDHLNILFPFEYSVKKELLMQSEKYTMSGFGGEVAFSLK